MQSHATISLPMLAASIGFLGLGGGVAASEPAHEHAACMPATAMSATGNSFVDFFTGGGHYMPRTHCLQTETGQTDWPWVIALLILTGAVVASYLKIFAFWMRCYFQEAPRDRNRKLFDLGMIFLLCATCGYAFSMLMFFWPGYRLLAGVLLILNFFSWRFCASLQPFGIAFKAVRLERELRESIQSRAVQLEASLVERTAELKRAERRFRTFVHNLPGVAFRMDRNGRLHFVSNGIEDLTGYPSADFTGKTARGLEAIIDPDDLPRVRESVKIAVTSGATYSVEYRIRTRSGDERWVLERGEAAPDESGAAPDMIDGLQFDITERKAAEDALRRNSLLDKLTGLPNRALLLDRIRQCIERHRRDPNSHFAVLFLDFDRFKAVNDTLGHDAGDELLRGIAGRLRTMLRPADTVARDLAGPIAGRIGGDEFVIILDAIHSPEDAQRVADRVLAACRAPHRVRGHEVTSTVSIGVVTSRDSFASAEDVLRDADAAMYQAKLAGKGCAVMFDVVMRERMSQRLLLEQELRGAAERGEFAAVFQPIVSLEDGRWVGAEALARWNNPRCGEVSPTEFIPIAEEAGLMSDLGEWILRQSLGQFAAWSRRPSVGLKFISVNISRTQLGCAQFPQRLQAILQETGVPASCVQLEVTENQAAGGGAEQVRALRALRDLDVRLAMDDFGTGLSSLSELHALPIDSLKIDRSFIRNLGNGKPFLALTRSIIELAHNLGLSTVAEGIETRDQVTALQALGCEHGQGYLFARPMNAAEFEKRASEGSSDEPRMAA